MQFEVPQFIEVEDKIFGPLTWRQFIYLGGGGGIAVTLFFTTPFIIFLIFGVPIGLLAVALAFYPVNNRPFSYFLEGIFGFTVKPKRYLWRKEQAYVYHEEDMPTQSVAAPVRKSGKDISSLARKLELEAIQKHE